MSGKFTYKTVRKYIEEYNCKLLTPKEEYKNTSQKLLIQCPCGNEFNRAFHDFKRRSGHMCTRCKSGTHRWTHSEVKKFIEDKGAILKSKEYRNSREKLDLICECGNDFSRNFKNFKDGKNYKCPRCGYHSLKYEDVKKTIEGKGCLLLSKTYENNFTPLSIQCHCKEVFKVSFREFVYKSRHRCQKCNKHYLYSYEEVKSIIEDVGCKLISKEYLNNSTKLDIQCKCGNLFQRKFNTFKDTKAYFCSSCSNSSNGEQEVSRVLEGHNINFTPQYKFEDCVFKRKLPFDFYLPEYNICIEFDGKQHFEPVEVFGGLDAFEDTQKRDQIKNQYCIDNNIKLIRIPYWDFFKVEEILNKELKL